MEVIPSKAFSIVAALQIYIGSNLQNFVGQEFWQLLSSLGKVISQVLIDLPFLFWLFKQETVIAAQNTQIVRISVWFIGISTAVDPIKSDK